MTRHSVQPKDPIFVKGYGFLPFKKYKYGKNISKNLSNNYSQTLLDHAEQFATDALKTASKTSTASGDLIEDKIANKITRVSKTFPKNDPETCEEKKLRETFIPSELRHETTDDLRLTKENYWLFKTNIII